MSERNPSGDARRPVPVPGHPGVYRRGSRYLVRVTIDGGKVTRHARTVREAETLRPVGTKAYL